MTRSLRSLSSRGMKSSESGEMSKAAGRRPPRSRSSRTETVPDTQAQNALSSTSRSPGRRGRGSVNAMVGTSPSAFSMPPSGGTRGRRPDFRSLSGKPLPRGNIDQHPPEQLPERAPRPPVILLDESEPEPRTPGSRKSKSSPIGGDSSKISGSCTTASSPKVQKIGEETPEGGDSDMMRSQENKRRKAADSQESVDVKPAPKKRGRPRKQQTEGNKMKVCQKKIKLGTTSVEKLEMMAACIKHKEFLQRKHFAVIVRSDVNDKIIKDVFGDIKKMLRSRPDYNFNCEARFCAETTTAFKTWYRSQKHQEAAHRTKKQAATGQASDGEETAEQKARRLMFDGNDAVDTTHMAVVGLAPADDAEGATEGADGGDGGSDSGGDSDGDGGGGNGSGGRNGSVGEGSGEAQVNPSVDNFDEEATVAGPGKGKAKAKSYAIAASSQRKPDEGWDSEATIDDIMEDRDLDALGEEVAADEEDAFRSLSGAPASGIPRKTGPGAETASPSSPPLPRNRRGDRLDEIARKIERENSTREAAMVEQAKAFNDIAGAFTKIVDRLALGGSTVSVPQSSRNPQSTLELMLRLQSQGVCTFGPAEYKKQLEALGVKATFPGSQAGQGRAGVTD